MKAFTLLVGMLAAVDSVRAQGPPNTVAELYPNYATMAASGTFWLLTIDSTTAQTLAGDYKLLQAPSFAEGTHPLLLWDAYQNDIRQNSLAIPSLRGSQIILPFIDRLDDGVTPFSKTVRGYIGSTSDNRLSGVIPALVGTTESDGGYILLPSIHDPQDRAYKSVDGRQLYSNVKLEVVPNDVSGPGVAPPAIDILFQFGNSNYDIKSINGVLNQPLLLGTGQCQRVNWRFNETFADTRPISGAVKLYSPAVPSELTGSEDLLTPASRTFPGSGLSGNGEIVLFPPEDCYTASRNVIVV